LWWRKLEAGKQLGKCKRNWVDVKEIGWGWGRDVDWFDLAQGRYKWWAVVITGMNPLNAGNLLSS
jgi:hypothetical protein